MGSCAEITMIVTGQILHPIAIPEDLAGLSIQTGSMETEYQLDRANVKIGSLHRGMITICSANTRLG